MDRILLSISSFILVLLVTILLGELEVIPFKIVNYQPPFKTTAKPIGHFKNIQLDVQKQESHSFLWYDAKTNDPLYVNDTIITQDLSRATLVLENNTEITLGENTLVVLNPIEEEGSIELNFNQGQLMANNPNKEIQLKAQKNWTLKLKKDSKVFIQKHGDKDFSFEVSKGQAQLSNNLNEKQTLTTQERAHISDNTIEKLKISDDLAWLTKNQTEYSKNFPLPYLLTWKGEAESLTLINALGQKSVVALNPQDQDYLIPLQEGTHSFILQNKSKSSATLTIHLKKTPNLTYFSPLPRERFVSEQNIIFSWSHHPGAKSYNLQFSRDRNFRDLTEEIELQASFFTGQPKLGGRLFWRVKVNTESDSHFFATEKREFFRLDEALSAPQLKAPTLEPRTPANKKQTPDQSIWYKKLLKKLALLVLPPAQAEGPPANPVQEKKIIILNWLPVKAATHYFIEISREESFQNPLVSEKVSLPYYEWDVTNTLVQDQEVFFWRVAAGGENDMMGLFSAVSHFSLGQLSNRHKEQPKNVKLKVIKTPPPAPLPEPKAPVVEHPLVTEAGPKNTMAFYIAANSNFFESQEKNSFSTRLQGFSNYKFFIDFKWYTQNKDAMVVTADFASNEWKSSTELRNVFQKQLEEKVAGAHFYYQPADSGWGYGIGGLNVSFFSRDDANSLKLVESSSYGLGVFYNAELEQDLNLHTQLEYHFHDKVNFAYLQLKLKYKAAVGDGTYFSAGPYFKAKSGQNDDFNFFSGQVGLMTGLEW